MVLTTLRGADDYPNTLQTLGYSGVYMPVQLENLARPIIKGTLASNDYNR